MNVYSFFVWMEFVLPDIASILQVDLPTHSIKSMTGLFQKKEKKWLAPLGVHMT